MSGMNLQPHVPLKVELPRAISAGLARVRLDLEDTEQELEARVFAARRRLKRVRAATRLLRAADPRAARRINAACREAGRVLSGARDADALVTAALRLSARVRSEAAREALVRLAERLDRARPDEAVQDAQMAEAAALVTLAQANLRAAHPRKTRRALVRGFDRLEAQAADAYLRLTEGGDPEARHDWRKRLKDKWHAARVARAVAEEVSPGLSARAEAAKSLAQLLGEERDLWLLHEEIARMEPSVRAPFAAADRAIQSRRSRLMQEAKVRGKALYRQG